MNVLHRTVVLAQLVTRQVRTERGLRTYLLLLMPRKLDWIEMSAAKEIRERLPEIPILLLSMNDSRQMDRISRSAGAQFTASTS